MNALYIIYVQRSKRARICGGGLEGMMLHSGDKLKTVRRRRQRIHERAIDRRRSRWATNAGRYRPARFVGCRVGQMVRWTKLLSLFLNAMPRGEGWQMAVRVGGSRFVQIFFRFFLLSSGWNIMLFRVYNARNTSD